MPCYEHKLMQSYCYQQLNALSPGLIYDDEMLSEILADHQIDSLETLIDMSPAAFEPLLKQLTPNIPIAA